MLALDLPIVNTQGAALPRVGSKLNAGALASTLPLLKLNPAGRMVGASPFCESPKALLENEKLPVAPPPTERFVSL